MGNDMDGMLWLIENDIYTYIFRNICFVANKKNVASPHEFVSLSILLYIYMIPLDDYYKKGYYYFQPDFLILLNKHKFITYQINLGAQFIFPILDLTTIFKMRS